MIKNEKTADLVKEYAKLKCEIEMKIFQYNKIGNELSKRLPTLQKEFKPKILVKDIDVEKKRD